MEKKYLESAKDLFQSIIALDSVEECASFFEDLCTIKEIEDMSQRFEVAKLLKEKKSYNEVSLLTGASTATISRVSRCLQYGAGYKTALSKLEEE
jgi:TrpR-related protein YerC/YecD